MRLPGIALLLLLPLPVSYGQGARAYATEFGRRVLARTDQLVEGRVRKLMPPFRGITTARIEVRQRLAGFDRGDELTLLFIEDYVAPDAFQATLERSTVRYERRRREGLEAGGERLQAPSADLRGRGVGVRLAQGEEGLFFLRREGASYSLIGLIPARDPLFEAKRNRLRDILALERAGPLDLRARRAKRLFLDSIEDPNPWLRGNSARELLSLARRDADLFEAEDARLLVQRLDEESEAPVLASLEGTLRALDAGLVVDYAREAEERARARHGASLEAEAALLRRTRMPEMRAADVARIAQRYRRASTALVVEFLADEAALVRERAAQALAEMGGPSACEPLRRALAPEKDLNAAMAMVYALGMHADAEAVPVVATRLKEPELEATAVHALARIGTPEARRALERHRRSAGPEIAKLIDDLVREEFAEDSS